MGDRSAIEWTDATWNPIRGCSRVSEGCRNCYAERQAGRHAWEEREAIAGAALGTVVTKTGAYHGLVKSTPAGPHWTGEVRFIEESLALPLRWRRPRRIFVNSMSDLFHEKVQDEWIDRIFAVMAQTPRHTYQVLTKRPERMREYSAAMASLAPRDRSLRVVASMYRGHPAEKLVTGVSPLYVGEFPWPLPNVWLGVSVEDRETYKHRVLYLANTPAAVRFVSFEPLLEDPGDLMLDGIYGGAYQWAIVGGESGPGARPFDLHWARQTTAQCRAAGVPVFVKQLGARPVSHDVNDVRFDDEGMAGAPRGEMAERPGPYPLALRDRKGDDWSEWPEDLRVREFPHA